MKSLVLILALGLTGTAAHAEPTAAFSQAYETARAAVLAHLNITEDRLGPAAEVARKKNEPGQFADFKVRFEIESREVKVTECEVKVHIFGSPATVRVNSIICN